MLAAEIPAAADGDQRHEEDCVGHIIRPPVALHKQLGIIDKREDGNKSAGDQELHCENRKDLMGGKKKNKFRS